MMKVPNHFRVTTGIMKSSNEDGNNGCFMVKSPVPSWGQYLTVIASDGGGWEHVSISLQNRTPTWEIMCFIKDLFWDDEDCVVQYHPPKSEYVNNHPYCLHLWRPTEAQMPRPPKNFVGI